MEQITGFLCCLWLIGAFVLAAVTLKDICLTLGSGFGIAQLTADGMTKDEATLAVEDAGLYADDARRYGRLLAHWVFDGLFVVMIFFVR